MCLIIQCRVGYHWFQSRNRDTSDFKEHREVGHEMAFPGFNLVIEILLISSIPVIRLVYTLTRFNLVIEILLISSLNCFHLCLVVGCFNLVIEILLISRNSKPYFSNGIRCFNLVIEILLISRYMSDYQCQRPE